MTDENKMNNGLLYYILWSVYTIICTIVVCTRSIWIQTLWYGNN